MYNCIIVYLQLVFPISMYISMIYLCVYPYVYVNIYI